MTEKWLRAETNRRRILSALWPLVKHAQTMETIRPAKVTRKICSFEAGSTVPPILIHAGLRDPTVLPKAEQTQLHLEDAGIWPARRSTNWRQTLGMP